MITLVIIALLGASALSSNTNTVTDWVKQSSASFREATATPFLAYPEGKYLKNGPKELEWMPVKERPAGFTLAPSVAKVPEKPRKVEVQLTLKPVERKIEETKASSQFGDVEDLGIITPERKNSTVNTEEILSFFTKSVTTSEGNERTGTIVAPANNQSGTTAVQSSAELETK